MVTRNAHFSLLTHTKHILLMIFCNKAARMKMGWDGKPKNIDILAEARLSNLNFCSKLGPVDIYAKILYGYANYHECYL